MDEKLNHTVVVLGASAKQERYSNRALKLLKNKGYRVIPVHPTLKQIEDLRVIHHLEDIQEHVHTLTVYVGNMRSTELKEQMLALNPDRVIFNPGAENAQLEARLKEKGISTCNACTIVMLHSGQF